MVSVLMNAAGVALHAASGGVGPGAAVKGSFQGKKITHWSYKVFIAGAVIGTITAIAGFILNMLPIGVSGVVIGATNGLAAFYIRKFSVIKTLEEVNKELTNQVKTLSDEVDELDSQISQLEDENKKLEEVSKGLAEIPKDWRKEIVKGKQEIAAKTNELEKVAQKLLAAEKKIEKLATVTGEMHTQANKITEAALQFSKENHFFSDHVGKLESQLGELNQHNQNLVSLIVNVDTQTDEFEQLNQEFGKQVVMLGELFALMKEMYEEAKKKMADLEIQVNELEVSLPNALKSAEKVEKLTLQYKQMEQALEQQLKNLKNHSKYKQGYKEWTAFKSSPEYQQFQQWIIENKS